MLESEADRRMMGNNTIAFELYPKSSQALQILSHTSVHQTDSKLNQNIIDCNIETQNKEIHFCMHLLKYTKDQKEKKKSLHAEQQVK